MQTGYTKSFGLHLAQAWHLFQLVHEYDGTGSIEGWLTAAPLLTTYLADPMERKQVLASRMRGAAQVWLQSKGQHWGSWNFKRLCDEVHTGFKADTALHSSELLELRHTGTITAFNKEL